MPSCSMRTFPFSAPHNSLLTMLVCATRWLFMHLYTLAHMSMHESCLLVCRPRLNTMKLWIFNPNLHLSLAETTFCLLSCLFAFSFVCLFACFLVSLLAMSIMLICFMPLSYAPCIFSFHYLSAGFLSLPLHVHTWSKDVWSEGTVSQAQAKRAWMQACRYEPSNYVQ